MRHMPWFPGSRLSVIALASGLGLAGQVMASDLTVNASVAPSTLDPAWACGLPEISFLSNFYVRLVDHGVKPGPEGTLERDYSVAPPHSPKAGK
ncbi:MAG: hypothetical protein QM699_11505 [Amaricoccus sp.]|uniref:hypothetical protein n=1 Tax=Amaricoccus sp. TaxID=1872485 RepID=UPI0039E6A3C3